MYTAVSSRITDLISNEKTDNNGNVNNYCSHSRLILRNALTYVINPLRLAIGC